MVRSLTQTLVTLRLTSESDRVPSVGQSAGVRSSHAPAFL